MADTKEPTKEPIKEPVRNERRASNFGKAVILTRIRWGGCVRPRGFTSIATRSWSGIQKLYSE